jgi:hypothetical protein
MKHISILLFFFYSLTVFAQETCFKANQVPSAESKIPDTICISGYQFETVIPELPKTPFFKASVQSSLGNTTQKVTFYDFEKAPFGVKVTIPLAENSDGTCSRLYRSSVIIEFKVDKKGETIPGNLNVEAFEEETQDNCHLQAREQIITFTKI